MGTSRTWFALGIAIATGGCRQLLGLHDLAPNDAVAIDGRGNVGDGRPGDGAAGDGPPGDVDGDGVPDDMDNCPDVANHDQGNEDGDRFGDVCDPCPFVKDDNPVDSDHDGVADPCDPHPATPGDRIIVFEGFHAGVPAGWTARGAWQGVGDDVTASAAAGDAELTIPVTPVGMLAIYAQIEATADGPGDSVFGTIGPYDPTQGDAVWCDLYQASTPPPQTMNLFDTRSQTGPYAAMAFSLSSPVVFEETWQGHAYTCTVIDSAGTMTLSNTDSTALPSNVGVATQAYDIRVAWIMLVDQGGAQQ